MAINLLLTGFNIFKKKHIDNNQYIKSDKWKRKAKACYKRAKYRCQLCGTNNRQLQAHHNTYENLGNEKPEDLICLCDLCHGDVTIILKQRKIGK